MECQPAVLCFILIQNNPRAPLMWSLSWECVCLKLENVSTITFCSQLNKNPCYCSCRTKSVSVSFFFFWKTCLFFFFLILWSNVSVEQHNSNVLEVMIPAWCWVSKYPSNIQNKLFLHYGWEFLAGFNRLPWKPHLCLPLLQVWNAVCALFSYSSNICFACKVVWTKVMLLVLGNDF